MKLRLVICLTLIALALSSFIPQGWMPAGSGDKMLLVLCVGDGTVERWVDLDDSDPLHDETDERMPCAYGALHSAELLPDTRPVLLLASTQTERWSHADFTHRSAGFYARYDARGPPRFL
ncbi:DUF2946 domain-containing protein [Ruegeria jejuensis]|uniref:DUF2946 domain-containing protein n=1 Tax=Ruegeria jejuensis TaxID=3233338 RepID=UPI00355B8F5F